MTDTEKQIFLILGLAGSGKTTFSSRLYTWLSSKNLEIDKSTGLNKNIFSVNLDPAVYTTKSPLNFDLRDLINYEDVMRDYNLGPNGAILASLNKFCANIERFTDEIKDQKYLIIDTPGQIESFTISISGDIIVKILKSLGYKLNILFVMDAKELENPSVFMSNMYYAASLKCKFESEITCVINKTDISEGSNFKRWAEDYSNFIQDLNENDEDNSSILSSMALYFEDIYKNIGIVKVSSRRGDGKSEFFEKFNI